jgi:tetratricopeptide (TPR) repeat protein
LSEAIQKYEEAIQIGSPGQRVLAQNNLAILFMRQHENERALEVFRNADFSSVPRSHQSLYYYNYGRALELSRELQAAYRRYLRALELQPGFDLAIDGAFRSLHKSKPARMKEASDLANRLLSQGETELVGSQIRKSLDVWAAEPEVQRLLAALLRYYVAASVDPPQFEKTEWKRLARLAEASPVLRRAVEEVRLVYVGDLAPIFNPVAATEQFRAWTREEWQYEALSQLLQKVGDFYDRREQPEKALARYSAAWMVDRDNTEAALYAAAVLRDHRATLDLDRQLLRQLVGLLFDQKSESYLRGEWLDILRFHVVLGTIFEGEKEWGSRQEPYSAIFQWEHALEADQRLRRANPDFPPSPGIHLHLGVVYSEKEKEDQSCQKDYYEDAWRQYILAAQGFIKLDNTREACKAVEFSRSLAALIGPVGEEKKQIILELEGAVDPGRCREFRPPL